MASAALTTAPGIRGTPAMTFSPMAQPATLPILKTRPPRATAKARK